MMTFTEFPLVQAIGWTLLHALWQGILIALVLRLLLFLIPNRAAVLRYGLSVGAIFLMLLWAAVTCWQHLPAEGSLLSAEIAPLAIDGIPDSNEVLYSSEGISAEKSAFSLVDVSNRLQPLLPYLVGIWLLGVLFWSIRFLGSMIYLYRLPRRHVWQPDAAWQRKLTALKKQLAISQQVRLLISSKIQEPLTMGFLRPVILIPASLLSNLPPEQIEAILLHELAHIRRADYVVNLLLSIVEILFFYHPAYWWISRQVKQEREHCCDDQVLKRSGDQITYAQALIAVQKLSTTHQNHLAMNFTGNKSQFTNRIHRLFGQAQRPNIFSGLSGLGILTFCLMLFVFSPFQQEVQAQQSITIENVTINPFEDENYSPMDAYEAFAKRDKPYKIAATADRYFLTINVLKADEQDLLRFNQELGELGMSFSLTERHFLDSQVWYEMELNVDGHKNRNLFANAGLLTVSLLKEAKEGKRSLKMVINPVPEELRKEGQTGVAMKILDFPKPETDSEAIQESEKNVPFDQEDKTVTPTGESLYKTEPVIPGDESLHPEEETVIGDFVYENPEESEEVESREDPTDDKPEVAGDENISRVKLEFEKMGIVNLDKKGNEKNNTFIMGPSIDFVIKSEEKTPRVLLIKNDGECFISWEAFENLNATTPPEDIETLTLITAEAAEKRYGEKKSVLIVVLKQGVTLGTKKNKNENTWVQEEVPIATEKARFGEEETLSDDAPISNWTIFPNPSQGKLHFDFEVKQAGEVEINILNLNGQIIDKVYSGYIQATRQLFTYKEENNNLANGVYLLQVKMGGAVVTKKFVIEK